MISVCMATYNGEKYLKEQVDSILIQLNEGDELIVSDDGSTDNTIKILNSYNDARIKILHHTKNLQKYKFGYTTENCENALNNAAGDIIFLADQDDVWVEGKVNRMVEKLKNCDIVLSDCSFVDANLDVLVSSKIKFEGVKIGAIRNLYKNGYLGSSMAFNRNILEYVLPFPKNVAHDLWIGLVGGYLGHFQLLPVVTMLYRRHDANVSSTNNNLLRFQNKNCRAIEITKNTNTLRYKIHYRAILVINFMMFVIGFYLKRIKLFIQYKV